MSVSKKRVFVRKLAVVALSAGMIVALTGCANGQFSTGSCTPLYSSGPNADLVSADGALSADPVAIFPTPLITQNVETSVVSDGSGEIVNEGDVTTLQITIYDAQSGAQLISTGHDSAGLRVSAIVQEPRFGEIAQCATVGSRLATVGAAGDILGTVNIAENGLALADDDVIVLITDIESRLPGKADGTNQLPPAGFPAVVLAPNGQPGFSFSGSEAPAELKFATLKRGEGNELREGDLAIMHMSGIEWDGRETFVNTWEDSGVPSNFLVESSETAERGLPPGLAEALIGQTVGSQVLIVLPPAVGFVPGSEPQGVTSGATLVWVFDILGVQEQ